jgi:hypothetical protein
MTDHLWVIDVLQEGTATLETHDGRLVAVPAARLPVGAREGHVVRVSTGDTGQPVRILADPAATEAALARSAAQLAHRAGAPDPTGDITL